LEEAILVFKLSIYRPGLFTKLNKWSLPVKHTLCVWLVKTILLNSGVMHDCFCRGVAENCAFLGYYAASSGNSGVICWSILLYYLFIYS